MSAHVGERFVRIVENDGLYTPSIKQHSVRKIRLHNHYVTLFSTATKNKWPQRAYLGLYAGAGRARVEESGEIVETSALSALQVRDPFTKYIFVDNKPECISALESRNKALDNDHDVNFIERDVSGAVPEIVGAMPSYSRGRGLLSFCFVDPFSAKLDFDVFRRLGTRYRMDFLVLLMLGRDIRTNFQRYYQDETDSRIADLIADESWRSEWVDRGLQARHLIWFVLDKFGKAMAKLGYQPTTLDEAEPVRIAHGNVLQYYLVLYSKHDLGRKLWRATRKGVDPQLGLGL